MKELDREKKLYQKLRNGKKSILFGEDDITNNIIKKLNLIIDKIKNFQI